MNDLAPGTCRNCGATLPSDAPNGACPRCLADIILSPPSAGSESAVPDGFGELINSANGNYRLLERIGEGKFGVVFRAEQLDPVRREVALKFVRPGMVSAEVIDRFEAERQALALMNHPSIAHVYDAGSTEAGRPYFVMELVRGLPITEHCDESNLSIENRLELFVDVCQAVQHAHQKGIIHRDLKPSNILVVRNGSALPKIIDFGIAKAINEKPSERLLATADGQFMGTPQYMSPEQVRIAGNDVDTRADIYALGALLYELLTGFPPLSGGALHEAGFAEVERLIREVDPPKPSQRIAGLGREEGRIIAKNRFEDPARFSRRLRGDLDWIVMRALEKDRDRRYETAAAFGEDIRRYLEDEPVSASPPSAEYRIRKFVQRNRIAAASFALVLAVLIVATSVSVFMADVAKEAREETETTRDMAYDMADRAMANILKTEDTLSDYLTAFELLEKGESDRALAHLAGAIRSGRHRDAAYRSAKLFLQRAGPRDVAPAASKEAGDQIFLQDDDLPKGNLPSHSSPPAWFADFLEALGGMRVAADGSLEVVEERRGERERIARHVKTLSADDEWAALVRWFLEGDAERTRDADPAFSELE